LGAARLELAEEAAQEALHRALRTWPFDGVPERPAAWLARVAQRAAVDQLRREARTVELEAALAVEAEPEGGGDDVLSLMLACCHPSLPPESRIALVLKTACGFGVEEIATGLLARPDSVKRRLSRARDTLRERDLEVEPDDAAARRARHTELLLALYLLFNEGYSTSREAEPVRVELVREALRLVRLVLAQPELATPEAHALLALFCFQAARLQARFDGEGTPLSLAEQDRSLWDGPLLAEGFAHLDRALDGERETRFHIEAAIAACHAAAPTWSATDCERLLAFYDALLELHPSPVVALNRCVVVAQVHGARAALGALDELASDARLPLRTTTRAQLLWLAGLHGEAVEHFEAALEDETSGPRRRFLRRRLELCRAGAAPIDW